MPQRTPNTHEREEGRGIRDLLHSVGALAGSLTGPSEPPSANPFGDALRESSESPDGLIAQLTKHAITLNPMVKRRLFPDLQNVPEGLTLGWAQLPRTNGRGFSLGVFTDRNHFAQIAFADHRGRVFAGTDPQMDTQPLEPRFMFGKEQDPVLADGARLGRRDLAGPTRVVTGGVIGRDDTGRMTWLAAWLKNGKRYTLEQSRADLPAEMRQNLEYRDAIAIAFFACYLLPQMNGLLVGFGSGNIFRRLNREAPIGAIRRSVRDTLEARAHGLRASGLEDHFADLMREAGAMDSLDGLEAVHGAEPLHLYTSSYSGSYFFAWDKSLPFGSALKSLKIEGNLNRFAAVSAWLENNAAQGLTPTEDTVTRAEAAQIDMRLLENPAIIALKPYGDGDVTRLVGLAGRTAEEMRRKHPDPIGGERRPSEWVSRQALSSLLRRLRLPYRFDVEFRADLEQRNVAIGFTTAGTSMMPDSRYDEKRHTWRALGDADRAAMSAAYNLRVGLIMAALSFGVDPQVERVSLHIDSIGLEEAVAEQDSAIERLMSEALSAFEHLRNGDVGRARTKADPKDGDVHGDPTRPITHDEPRASIAPADPLDMAGEMTKAEETADAAASADLDGQSLDSRFEDLMRDIDIDDMTFASSDFAGDRDDFDDDFDDFDEVAHGDAGGLEDPMSVLRRNPTVRNMVSVTFTREEFLARLAEDGLEHPNETYRIFDAVMDVDEQGGLRPVNAGFDLRDARFSPLGSQEEPELVQEAFSPAVARVLGTADSSGLSIQREDLLQRAVVDFHGIAADQSLDAVSKAQQAMRVVEKISDPELTELAPRVTSALIDGKDTPDIEFTMADDLDKERVRARDLLFSGQTEQAVAIIEEALGRLDAIVDANPGVPRYFNSYAERVVYNRLFATSGEHTVLIPDNLFYAHMELGDILAQLKGPKASLPHLNRMVAFAPAYPLTHLRLAIQLARGEDWNSARAACLNALRVALDRSDAAFAYYRFAYCEWMQDRFDTAVAAYIMSDHISPGQIGALETELQELVARADSQCVRVPESVSDAVALLESRDLPVWPHTEVASIVRDAARVCVDEGMFVPARTLSVAAARMNDGEGDNIDVVQAQFLRSLSA
ncbi:tetratricopeptide repeat protein [Bifidobacterium lemurum]|uniref:Tetratricopeptide repeat protein n=1 Tax=Bifidobacterium lemurum TaxID=1603886 RepID=A0A261FT12_9BIFI|nr:tetratricopeptide repeat protein [Bifidobacterium lemurum]